MKARPGGGCKVFCRASALPPAGWQPGPGSSVYRLMRNWSRDRAVGIPASKRIGLAARCLSATGWTDHSGKIRIGGEFGRCCLGTASGAVCPIVDIVGWNARAGLSLSVDRLFHTLKGCGPERSLIPAGRQDGTDNNRAAGRNFQAAQRVGAFVWSRTAGNQQQADRQ